MKSFSSHIFVLPSINYSYFDFSFVTLQSCWRKIEKKKGKRLCH